MLPLNLVKEILRNVKKEVILTVFESKEMYEFARKLSEFNEFIKCEFLDYPEPKLRLPAIKLDKSKIFFHAVPRHSELQSFLFALKVVAEKSLRCENEEDADVTIVTFVSQFCPNCQATVNAINKMTQSYCIEHHVVDAELFSEIAEKFGIVSVPTAIIDGMKFTGAMSVQEVEKWIKAAINEDYYEYLAEKLMNGEIEEVKRVAEDRNIGEELGKLMAHREFMVRLGAMAALEALHEMKPEIAEEARKVITELLNHDDERIREDAAMMLGIIGSEKDIKNLKELIEEGGRIGDSAEEAIKNIRRKKNG
ncbi:MULTISPECIES: thioredoxin family protein [unclassified Archaeoglobus]|jgi:thiol-disulfide isomerase/thioredoxin|uniref:thioredoxin family protein n=1 Tax=unclassified Archaeoglobus TaxID=2643606 RepID=UPI0025BF76D6|nr:MULTISPECIES: thioredoxin family protein [unclassified Archaeoglobus]